jgi:mycoredoxin
LDDPLLGYTVSASPDRERDMTTTPEPATANDVTMYWRPGCGFCSALRRRLQALGVSFTEIDIWEDPAAAEFVRSVARGNEVVPTITVGNTALVNPTAEEVLALTLA